MGAGRKFAWIVLQNEDNSEATAWSAARFSPLLRIITIGIIVVVTAPTIRSGRHGR